MQWQHCARTTCAFRSQVLCVLSDFRHRPAGESFIYLLSSFGPRAVARTAVPASAETCAAAATSPEDRRRAGIKTGRILLVKGKRVSFPSLPSPPAAPLRSLTSPPFDPCIVTARCLLPCPPRCALCTTLPAVRGGGHRGDVVMLFAYTCRCEAAAAPCAHRDMRHFIAERRVSDAQRRSRRSALSLRVEVFSRFCPSYVTDSAS